MSEKHEASMNYPAGNTEQEPGSALGLEEFTAQEIAGLVEAQSRFQNGYLSEWPDNYKQLRFARWLYEHRHIEG
jgi:hypothetical protein